MSIAFSVAIYLAVGLAACAWLRSQARLPRGIGAHVTAVLIWPAYLPVSVAAQPVDGAFASVRRQIRRLSLGATQRREHLALIDRLERSFVERRGDIARWRAARARLAEVAAEIGADGSAFAAEEDARLERAVCDAEGDLARARESIVRLTLRLELFELRTSHESLDAELRGFIGELDALLCARAEAERIV